MFGSANITNTNTNTIALTMMYSFHSMNLIPAEFLNRDLAEIVDPLPATVMKKKDQKRCGACAHKLLLSDLACRCDIRFCSKHRLPEDHACTFDHKALKQTVVGCSGDKMSDRC